MASYRRAGTNLYDLVDRFFNDGFSVNTPLKNIILDVQEFDDKYIVEADVPGIEKKNINVTFNNDYLKIELQEDSASDESGTEANASQGKEAEEAKSEGGAEQASETTKEEPKAESTSTASSTASTEGASHYIHRERLFATVNRVIYLKGATSKGITANLKDGVLTLVVPKREDAMNQNQSIPID